MIMNSKEIMVFLGISKGTLYKYMKDGLPVMRRSNARAKLLFDRDDVVKWMKGGGKND